MIDKTALAELIDEIDEIRKSIPQKELYRGDHNWVDRFEELLKSKLSKEHQDLIDAYVAGKCDGKRSYENGSEEYIKDKFGI